MPSPASSDDSEGRRRSTSRRSQPRDHRLGLRAAGRERSDEPLTVEGDLPEWLSGVLLRNGPGTFRVGDRRVRHWFDGLAMLRRFEVGDGEVHLTTRFLRSQQYRHVRRHGELAFSEFETNPRKGRFASLRSLFGEPTDNAVVTVAHHADRHLALTETSRAIAFDPRTLDTEETVEFDDAVTAVAVGSVAHVHRDPFRRETVGVATAFGRKGGYVPYRLPDGASEREPITRIRRRNPAYVHSFALTPSRLVITEHPFRFHPTALLRRRSFAEAFRWRPDKGTRFTVVDRTSGAVSATYETAPFFVFHHVNAFESDGAVVVDLLAFPDSAVIDAFRLETLDSPGFAPPGAELRRYRLDPSGTVVMERLHPGPLEFPTVDYAGHNGRPYRFVYGVGNRRRPPQDFPNRIVKVDLDRRTTRAWGGKRTYPSEPLFVPRQPREPERVAGANSDESTPPGDEDDGVLLSVVLDADAAESFLLVLDDQTMEECARATLPEPLPFDFHGQFYRNLDAPTRTMA